MCFCFGGKAGVRRGDYIWRVWYFFGICVRFLWYFFGICLMFLFRHVQCFGEKAGDRRRWYVVCVVCMPFLLLCVWYFFGICVVYV